MYTMIPLIEGQPHYPPKLTAFQQPDAGIEWSWSSRHWQFAPPESARSGLPKNTASTRHGFFSLGIRSC